jgi:hypothetical protein
MKLKKEEIESMIEGLVNRRKLMSEFIEVSQKLECYRLAEKYRQRYLIIQAGIIRLRNYKINH